MPRHLKKAGKCCVNSGLRITLIAKEHFGTVPYPIDCLNLLSVAIDKGANVIALFPNVLSPGGERKETAQQ